MNADCMEMRRRIEISIGNALEPDERDEIERHCTACESCRMYRERLLGDHSRLAEFAAPCVESIGRVQERAIERVRAAEWAPRGRAGRVVARIPRVAAFAAAAAATVIVAFVAIDIIRGGHNGPVPAFAAVQEKMQSVENVMYRVHTWKLGQWKTREEGIAKPRRSRKDFGDKINVVDIYRGGCAILVLYPAEKRAVTTRAEYPAEQYDAFDRRVPNPVDYLATWYKAKDFSFIRKERLNGKATAVYDTYTKARNKKTKRRMTAWIDLDTELPVRFEMVGSRRNYPDPDSEHYQGLRLSDFQTEDSKRGSWIDVKEGEPVCILDNFRWGASVDTSCFSTVPPAGYRVETRSFDSFKMAVLGSGMEENIGTVDTCKTEGRATSETAVKKLSTWLSISGNVFPGDLQDLNDSTKVNKLLIAKYRRGGDPAEEFRAALSTMEELGRINTPSRRMIWVHENIDIQYAGKGLSFGDSQRIVCWLKDGNKLPCPDKGAEGPYYFIYGDLHIAASPTPPKSVGE